MGLFSVPWSPFNASCALSLFPGKQVFLIYRAAKEIKNSSFPGRYKVHSTSNTHRSSRGSGVNIRSQWKKSIEKPTKQAKKTSKIPKTNTTTINRFDCTFLNLDLFLWRISSDWFSRTFLFLQTINIEVTLEPHPLGGGSHNVKGRKHQDGR